MTKMITYADSFDMSSWGILTDFAGGDFGVETANKFTVLSATQKYVFDGSGFTYDSNGVPMDGTITHIKVIDQAGATDNVQLGKMDLTVQQLETFALTNDVTGLESTIFSGNDTFNVGDSNDNNGGAVVHLQGFGGNDTFNFGYDFNQLDTIDGGSGYNTVNFVTDYPEIIAPGEFQNIQKIVLSGGNINNILEVEDPNMSGGKTLTIDAHALSSSESITISTYSEPTNMIGGAGNDSLFGGTANDHITGGLGADFLSGYGGRNTYIYNSVAESTGANSDIIKDFNPKLDHLQMPNAVTAIDAPVMTGALDSSQFDADMSAALAGHLGANHAILFTADSGNLAGFTYLVVDQNGQAGYQSGGDIDIIINGPHLIPQHLDLLSAANFIV